MHRMQRTANQRDGNWVEPTSPADYVAVMPTTLHLRALRPDDAPAVTWILAEMERREPVDESYDEPEVLEEMSSPAIDLARGSVAVLDGETLVAFGALSISAPNATSVSPSRTATLPRARSMAGEDISSRTSGSS